MAMPEFSMRRLLEAGVHFGHVTRRWNPKMEPFIFGVRNNVHIIDLQQTVPMLTQALMAIRAVVAGGGRVLFVGTKRQASEILSDSAKRCGQYYVNHRWLGGMLTNWKTISRSIKRLRDLDERLADEEESGLTKKELLGLTRERDKLERALGGIKEMGALPDILFVIDTNKEDIAIAEARKLNIPVVAVIDSNSNPESITYPIPGNDDSLRAISLYCELAADSVLDGLQEEMRASGVDVGGAEEAPVEHLEEAAASAPEPEATPSTLEAAAVTSAPEPETAPTVPEPEAAPSTPEAAAVTSAPEPETGPRVPEPEAAPSIPEAAAGTSAPEPEAAPAAPEPAAEASAPEPEADMGEPQAAAADGEAADSVEEASKTSD